VKEAKVNLEWKIALKLKQRLQQNAGVEEKLSEEEDPLPPNSAKKPHHKPSTIPSHVVKTLEKSR
jgi:hypothetical protein